jgi:hypothetical protein
MPRDSGKSIAPDLVDSKCCVSEIKSSFPELETNLCIIDAFLPIDPKSGVPSKVTCLAIK